MWLRTSMLPCAYEKDTNETSTCPVVPILFFVAKVYCLLFCLNLTLKCRNVLSSVIFKLALWWNFGVAGWGPNHLCWGLTSDTPFYICAGNSPRVLQLCHCPSWSLAGDIESFQLGFFLVHLVSLFCLLCYLVTQCTAPRRIKAFFPGSSTVLWSWTQRFSP